MRKKHNFYGSIGDWAWWPKNEPFGGKCGWKFNSTRWIALRPLSRWIEKFYKDVTLENIIIIQYLCRTVVTVMNPIRKHKWIICRTLANNHWSTCKKDLTICICNPQLVQTVVLKIDAACTLSLWWDTSKTSDSIEDWPMSSKGLNRDSLFLKLFNFIESTMIMMTNFNGMNGPRRRTPLNLLYLCISIVGYICLLPRGSWS